MKCLNFKKTKQILTLSLLLILILLLSLSNLNVTFGITNLDKPRNPCAYSSGTSIFLEWGYSYSGLGTVYFEIYELIGTYWSLRDDTIRYTPSYTTFRKTFTGQSIGRHIYSIRAKELSFPINYGPFTINLDAYVLRIPTGLRVEHVSNQYHLKLSWDIVDPLATNVQVWKREPSSSAWALRVTLPETETTWTDTNVVGNKKYDYRIRAIRRDDTGIKDDCSSDSASVSKLTLPAPPTNFKANAIDKTIYMSWSHTRDCDGYKIYIYEKTLFPPPFFPGI